MKDEYERAVRLWLLLCGTGCFGLAIEVVEIAVFLLKSFRLRLCQVGKPWWVAKGGFDSSGILGINDISLADFSPFITLWCTRAGHQVDLEHVDDIDSHGN